MPQRYNTGNSRPSNSMKDINDNALAFDDYMNTESDIYIDRFGNAKDSLSGTVIKIIAAAGVAVEATRQSLIPLSKQYMTLADAQADIANIPDGSTTYVRSVDGSSLADEYINNGGTLEATGRKMPAQAAVDDALAGVTALNLLITDSYLPQGYSAAITDPEGNAAALINDGGGFEIPELIVGDSSSAGEDMPVYVEAHTDEDGNLAMGIRDDGVVETPDLLAGSLSISKDSLPDWSVAFTDEKNNVALGVRTGGEVEAPELMTAGVDLKKTELPGWSVAWTDKNGNIAMGIRDDGSVYPEPENNGIIEFSAADTDVIAILGDSYTDSLFTLKDKSYISKLSALLDYRFKNFGVSGNTAPAINQRLVSHSVYFDGKTFAQMNAKYAIIMTYANDAAKYIAQSMEYYAYNMSRLIDSVMAYGAIPIVVAEWNITNQAAAQLKAICESRGIKYIFNGSLMKEMGNLVVSPFHQGHPCTRTNGVIWVSLLEELKRLHPANRSIKIYRQRPAFSPLSDADMLFSDRIDLLKKWKEIGVPHRSLPDNIAPYFEEMNGRGDVREWTFRPDEYDQLGGSGVAFTDRLLVNITYPNGAEGLSLAGFILECTGAVDVYIRNMLDVASNIGDAVDADYLSKYKNPPGAWKKVGSGSGEYIFTDALEMVMSGRQIQVMLKSTAGSLVNIRARYAEKYQPAAWSALPGYTPVSVLHGETFESMTTWDMSGVTSIIPLDQVNTPRNLAYNGPLATVASLMTGSVMKKTIGITSPADRDITQPLTLQVELWGRYFPKAFLDNSIYNLDPAQVVDSSQPENTFPAASPVTSDTCDFRTVTLRSAFGASMNLPNTITQREFTGLFWRPMRFILETPPYETISQITLEITSDSDYIQLAKIFIKEVK
ncbi:flagellar biosynthesis%2C cell-distal portion of basal-body rod [Raoultella planticola]|uniref:Flagellar biosynthesis, cell-distal portion of basal-body rod n=2 Tax=Raoultella planticola TaxID=575 RepID=A0A8G2A3E1_RAOPL|nr:flagellar biosynthesis%2C cell-distal portion of basal-body rod [Raoultella planticola]